MTKVAKFCIPVIILFFLAAYGGYILGGHKKQQKIERQFELLNYSSYATAATINVKLLNLIEEKKYKNSEELLENLIDINLASLSLYDKLASSYPDQKIFDAITTVNNHRAKHPGHKVNKTLANAVERAYKIVKSDK
jgi:hypothetical protein